MGIRFVVIAKHKVPVYLMTGHKHQIALGLRLETITHSEGHSRANICVIASVLPSMPCWCACDAAMSRRSHARICPTMPQDDPWTVIDLFDDRSRIENSPFCNSK